MNILTRTFVAGALVLSTAACGDDDTGPNGNGTLTAQIDGQDFTSSLSVQATYASNVVTIGGVNGNQQQILFTIPNVTAAGTFNLGVGNGGVAQVVIGLQAWTTSLVGGTGSVTITRIDNDGAAGTFIFTGIATAGSGATGTKAVTNGAFEVEF